MRAFYQSKQNFKAQLASGFDPNRLNGSGWSSLMYAAYLGHDLVCATLLKAAATVDLSNPNGQTALMFAATCGNLSVVSLNSSISLKL